MTYLLKCDPDTGGCDTRFPGDLLACPKCGCEAWLCVDASLELDPTHYTYDIETYPNAFTCVTTHVASGQQWVHEISDRRDDKQSFIEFMYQLNAIDARNVGFNNVGFDYPVIHSVLTKPQSTVTDIYNAAMGIIHSNDRFGNTVWESDHVVKQIDLYKVHHFDNAAKSTSLKALEFAMRMSNIEDLPFDVGKNLSSDEIDTLIRYNKHDVKATSQFYVRTLPELNLRKSLSEKYGVNMTNYSDSKIGSTILIGELEKVGIQCFERVGGRKSPRQTMRPEIKLADVIFPYVKFETPQFGAIYNFINQKVITQTKGAFHNVDVTGWPEDWLCPKEEWPSGFSIKEINGRMIASSLHVRVNNVVYWFGTGGLHASILSQIVKSDDDYQIIDVDVASYYPNLAIMNKMYPAHLGVEFCDIYLSIYEQRRTFDGGTSENKALKTALNASFGNSNNKYSPLYDPFYTMQTTINGQLLLCMLVEQLIKVPGLTMVQCNTDGVTYRCPRQYIDHTRSLCRWWEQLTKLELEEALYSRMLIRDVNNYIAEYEGGKVKRKGAYEYNRGWHQNHSELIVPKAVFEHLVNGKDLEEFIRNHKDPFDFCSMAKVPRSNNLVMRWADMGIDIQLPNIIRYFISTDGGSLVKIAPPTGKPGTWKRKPRVPEAEYQRVLGEQSIAFDGCGAGRADCGLHNFDADGVMHDERIHTKNKSKHTTREMSIGAGWLVTDCSNMDNFDWSTLNYDYYINEAKKLIDPLVK